MALIKNFLRSIIKNAGMILLLFVPLAILGIVLWEKKIRYEFFPRRFGVVESGEIYRSGKIAPRLIKKVLSEHNIKMIITLAGDSESDPEDSAEKKAAEELGIERIIFSLRGNGTGDVNDFAKIISLICQAKKEGKPVLVHCRAGTHRTGAIIRVYRILIQGKDGDAVTREMEQYGFNPNGDLNLKAFLNNNMIVIARKLQEMGVIEKIPEKIPKISD